MLLMRPSATSLRTITANAGVLLVRVVYVKSSGERTFLICDGGMNAHLPASVNRDRFLTAVAVGAGTGAVGAGAGAGEVSDA